MAYFTDLWFYSLGFDCVWNNTIYVFDEVGFQWNPTRSVASLIDQLHKNKFRYLSVTIPGQGIGRFLVTMNLFKTPSFDVNATYAEPPKLMITENNNLHVGLRYLQPSNGGVLQAWVLHLVCK